MSEKSLQINISSVDDAKSVVANLKQIKVAYDAHNCTSVEFCIAEEVVTPCAPILMGMVPWTITYRRIMKCQENNVLFSLPHYPSKANPLPSSSCECKPVEPAEKPQKVNRYLRNLADAPRQVSQPVPAASGVT